MKILSAVLLILGAMISFGSKKIVTKVLKGKREANEADYVYTKLVGFAIVIIAFLLVVKF